MHRELSKKKKGGCNRWKAKQQLIRLYEKISDQRNDFLHKLSTKIVKENDTIFIEDLQVKKMIENAKWNVRNFFDCSWSKFVRMLECKAESAGADVVRVNPMNTSKKCSSCGAIHDMPLSKRVYACACGLNICRDINAARNILAQGLGLAETLKLSC